MVGSPDRSRQGRGHAKRPPRKPGEASIVTLKRRDRRGKARMSPFAPSALGKQDLRDWRNPERLGAGAVD